MSKRETMTEKLRRMNAAQQVPELEMAVPIKSESQMFDEDKSNISISEIRLSEVHPAAGGRGDFLKVTVTMDPDDFEAINAEMVRRKRGKEKGAQLSGCIREAIRFWRAAGMPRQQ